MLTCFPHFFPLHALPFLIRALKGQFVPQPRQEGCSAQDRGGGEFLKLLTIILCGHNTILKVPPPEEEGAEEKKTFFLRKCWGTFSSLL